MHDDMVRERLAGVRGFVFDMAAARIGVKPERLAVVGDDPELEVPMAHHGRALAIAVGTGLGATACYDGLPAVRRPHLLVRGVDELLAIVTAPM